jgi:hypothetical protein
MNDFSQIISKLLQPTKIAEHSGGIAMGALLVWCIANIGKLDARALSGTEVYLQYRRRCGEHNPIM